MWASHCPITATAEDAMGGAWGAMAQALCCCGVGWGRVLLTVRGLGQHWSHGSSIRPQLLLQLPAPGLMQTFVHNPPTPQLSPRENRERNETLMSLNTSKGKL